MDTHRSLLLVIQLDVHLIEEHVSHVEQHYIDRQHHHSDLDAKHCAVNRGRFVIVVRVKSQQHSMYFLESNTSQTVYEKVSCEQSHRVLMNDVDQHLLIGIELLSQRIGRVMHQQQVKTVQNVVIDTVEDKQPTLIIEMAL